MRQELNMVERYYLRFIPVHFQQQLTLDESADVCKYPFSGTLAAAEDNQIVSITDLARAVSAERLLVGIEEDIRTAIRQANKR